MLNFTNNFIGVEAMTMQPKDLDIIIYVCFMLMPYNSIHSLGDQVYFEHQCEWEPLDIVIMFYQTSW